MLSRSLDTEKREGLLGGQFCGVTILTVLVVGLASGLCLWTVEFQPRGMLTASPLSWSGIGLHFGTVRTFDAFAE